MKKLMATLAGGALLAFPLVTTAQQDAGPPRPPSTDETIHGTVDSLPDHYTLLLHDDRGFIDTVTLRDQTVVNPSDLNLTQGLSISIVGHVNGKTFVADEVDSNDAGPNGGNGAQNAPQPNRGYDDQGSDNGPPPSYQAPPDVAPDGPAYESNSVDPGYDVPPDAVYGEPYDVGPAYGVAVGGYPYYGGYPSYGVGFGFYGGGYYGGGYYGGGYYGRGYYGHPYRGSYPGGYNHGYGAPGYGAPGYGRSPQFPRRQSPGYGYPTNAYRSPGGGGSYRAAPQSTNRGGASHAQSSSNGSVSSPHH